MTKHWFPPPALIKALKTYYPACGTGAFLANPPFAIAPHDHPHTTMQLFKRLLILTSLTICAPAQARPVTATVYSDWYSGRTTACGNTYEHWGAPTAAHPWLPCGTPVRVSRKGRSLTVRIRDRCDCTLDLSASAAYRLGVPLDGIATVHIDY